MQVGSNEIRALSRAILEEVLGILRELPEQPEVDNVQVERMTYNTFRRVSVKVSDTLSLNISVCEARKP